MDAAEAKTIVFDDVERRERAKARLYVLFQLVGWGFFWVLQVAFAAGGWLKRNATLHDRIEHIASATMTIALGLLLSHYGRWFIERWGWKGLGWRALFPRVLALSAVQSAIWIGIGFAWPYLVLRTAWPSPTPWPVIAIFVWFQGLVSMAGWHCIYFFYHLFDRYNRLEIERLRLGANVKEAELRALKSQVNPHFIFNSLNSLRALIDEEPARAREAVTQLANLLRYSLQSGQLETVPFEDELRIVNDYLALEQIRHEERLRVRLDIDPETLALPIPPLLLQTLVENAVKYGISTKPEGGEIAIVARKEDEALRLQVSNPGELGAVGVRSGVASTGVGLRNAAERLRLLFGERATLQLRAADREKVVAEAILPLEPLRG